MMEKVIFWDFHGTLTYPESLWSHSVYMTAKERLPEPDFSFEDCRAHLDNDHFPWHHPERTYLELTDPARWWAYIEKLFINTYLSLGVAPADAGVLAPYVREKILNPSRFRLYEGAVEALQELSGRGWKHIMVSNNFPELRQICISLGIDPFFADYVVSALVGYDKPRKEIFEIALERAGHPTRCVMIGDNPIADGQGAKQAGIPCILLHTSSSDQADYTCANFQELTGMQLLQ